MNAVQRQVLRETQVHKCTLMSRANEQNDLNQNTHGAFCLISGGALELEKPCLTTSINSSLNFLVELSLPVKCDT